MQHDFRVPNWIHLCKTIQTAASLNCSFIKCVKLHFLKAKNGPKWFSSFVHGEVFNLIKSKNLTLKYFLYLSFLLTFVLQTLFLKIDIMYSTLCSFPDFQSLFDRRRTNKGQKFCRYNFYVQGFSKSHFPACERPTLRSPKSCRNGFVPPLLKLLLNF